MEFNWDEIQYKEDGYVLLLYRHERIFSEGLVKPWMRVLDVGGWGHLAKRLRQEGCDCLIIDNFSEDQYYPGRIKTQPHVVGDILDPDLDIGKFDLVTCFEMLEHCGDIEGAIKNMHSILKPVGRLVGTVPLPGPVHAADEPGIEFVSIQELLDILIRAGFIGVAVEETPSVHPEGTPTSLYFKGIK